jgi:hypothetical protein
VLRLREMVVSKCHALIWYGTRESGAAGDDGYGSGRDADRREEKEKGFWIVDCGMSASFAFALWIHTDPAPGSTHGTFLLPPSSPAQTTPQRLSEPRQASLPFKLDHLTRLTIGTTTFEAHLHAEWPCDSCALHDSPAIALSSTSPPGTNASTPTTPANRDESPITLPNANEWKRTEPRRLALTSEQRKGDTRRRAGDAMRSLRAQYFGKDADAQGKGKKGGKGG